jgi:hypothetical protein
MNTQKGESSIFDASYKTINPCNNFFWQKPPSNFKLKKNKVVYSGTLQEVDSTSMRIYSPKIYKATSSQIMRFSDTKSVVPEAILDLYTPRLKWFKEDSTWRYGFCLTAHGNTLKFLVESKEEAHKWYNNIKSRCNACLFHFSKNYTLQKIIYRNDYYKIQYALNNEAKSKFIVKSIFKPRIIDNSMRLVTFNIKEIGRVSK